MWEIFCPRKEEEERGRGGKEKEKGLDWNHRSIVSERKKDRSWRVFMGVREKGRNRRSQLDGRRKKEKMKRKRDFATILW